MSRRSRGKIRTQNPTFFVFCEGESEEEYVKFLKREYRLPIQIKSRITGTNISAKLITRTLKEYDHHKEDMIFLMYDRDRDDINLTLDSILNAVVIGTLPCIEFWFLLHYELIRSTLTSNSVTGKLTRYWYRYEKGKLSQQEQVELRSRVKTAIQNAEKLPSSTCNSFSQIDIFIKELERVKAEKRQ